MSWDQGVVITYGDTVHSKYTIAPHLEVHEAVHIKQQESVGPEAWYKLYLNDKKFRLSQELEAYKAQIDFLKGNITNKGSMFECDTKIQKIIKNISGAMYGHMISEDDARRALDPSIVSLLDELTH